MGDEPEAQQKAGEQCRARAEPEPPSLFVHSAASYKVVLQRFCALVDYGGGGAYDWPNRIEVEKSLREVLENSSPPVPLTSGAKAPVI
jgi:hypothetical protein